MDNFAYYKEVYGGALEEGAFQKLSPACAAVLSVLTGYVVQTQLVAGGKKESAREAYLEYASAILRQA